MSGQRSDVEHTMDHYIRQHCVARMKKKGGRASILAVTDVVLCTILFIVTRAFGSLGSHVTTKAQMTYAIEYGASSVQLVQGSQDQYDEPTE